MHGGHATGLPAPHACVRPLRSGRNGTISGDETHEFNPSARVTDIIPSPSSQSLGQGLGDRRRRILDAATGLFLRAAYDAVQMDDIARAAGVAKPTVYRHFATKEALFLEALAAVLGELRAKAAVLAATAEPPAARLRALIGLLGQEIARLKALMRATEGSAAGEGAGGRRVLRRELRALSDEIGRVIEDGIAQGEFAPTEPRLAALAVLGAIRMATDGPSHQGAKLVADLLLEGLVRRDRPSLRP